MRRTRSLLSLPLLLAAGCEPAPRPPARSPLDGSRPAAPPETAPAADVAAMDAAVAALMARPEQAVEKVRLQYVLIAFQGLPRVTGVTRSMDQARTIAADVFKRATRGESFTALMKQHSDDAGAGIHEVTKAGRKGMVPSLGDVGFRLKVGEIGAAPYDPDKSPYGWQVIKRLE